MNFRFFIFFIEFCIFSAKFWFFPDFAPNSRKEWRTSLFNQLICENNFENCRNFWNLWKLFNFIQSCLSAGSTLSSSPDSRSIAHSFLAYRRCLNRGSIEFRYLTRFQSSSHPKKAGGRSDPRCNRLPCRRYLAWVASKRFEISKFKFKIPRARTSELQGSFSAVSKPNFASKYSLESSRRDLHNALLCTVL